MVAATTVVSQDIWLYVMMLLFCCIITNIMASALAQAQLVQEVLSQVLAAVLVPLVVDSAVDSLPAEDLLLVDHVLPHVTSAVDQTILLVIARLRL